MPRAKRRIASDPSESSDSARDAGAHEDNDTSGDVDDSAGADPAADERGEPAQEPARIASAEADPADFPALLHAELTADTIQHYLNRISVKTLLTVSKED